MSTTHYSSPAGPVDLEPDVPEVLQAEAPLACLPVRIEGVVRTQGLPTKDRTARTISVDQTAFVPLLKADPYRAFAEVTAFDDDMILAYSKNAQVGDTNTERVPKGITRRITARTEVLVMGHTTTTAVSMAQERWAQE